MKSTCLVLSHNTSRRSLKNFLPGLPARAQRWAVALAAALALPLCLCGQGLTDGTNVPVNLAVPDNDPDGLAIAATVSTPIQALTNLEVTLTVTNGWNGDLYAYLVHDSGFVVLLNRVGQERRQSVWLQRRRF